MLEPPDHLVHEPAHLGEISPDGPGLFAQDVADLRRQPLLERGGRCGERVDLLPRLGEQRLEGGAVGALLDPLLRALDRALVHARQG